VSTLTIVVFIVAFVGFALLDGLEEERSEELDPLAIARPSVKRLDTAADRALEELRRLGDEER
jgi:hypothetical protein